MPLETLLIILLRGQIGGADAAWLKPYIHLKAEGMAVKLG